MERGPIRIYSGGRIGKGAGNAVHLVSSRRHHRRARRLGITRRGWDGRPGRHELRRALQILREVERAFSISLLMSIAAVPSAMPPSKTSWGWPRGPSFPPLGVSAPSHYGLGETR